MPERNPLAAFARWAQQREHNGYTEYEEIGIDESPDADQAQQLRYHILRGEAQILDCFPGQLGEYIYPERRPGRMPPLRERIPFIWWDVYELFNSCVQFLSLNDGRQGSYHRPYELEYHQAMANVVAEALVELERLVRDSRYADLLPAAHPFNGDAEALAILQAFDAALVARSTELPPPSPCKVVSEGRKYPEGSFMALLGFNGPSYEPFACKTESDARQLALSLVREASSFLSLGDERSVPTLGWRLDALLWFAALVASANNPEWMFSLKPEPGSGESVQAMYNALIGELVRAYEVLIGLLGERWATLEAHHAPREPRHHYTSFIRQLQTYPSR